MLVPRAHTEVASGLLLCRNTIAGEAPPKGQHGRIKFKLLVSPVNPAGKHVGAFAVPSSTLVLTVSAAPALKLACELQQCQKC